MRKPAFAGASVIKPAYAKASAGKATNPKHNVRFFPVENPPNKSKTTTDRQGGFSIGENRTFKQLKV